MILEFLSGFAACGSIAGLVVGARKWRRLKRVNARLARALEAERFDAARARQRLDLAEAECEHLRERLADERAEVAALEQEADERNRADAEEWARATAKDEARPDESRRWLRSTPVLMPTCLRYDKPRLPSGVRSWWSVKVPGFESEADRLAAMNKLLFDFRACRDERRDGEA